ncbi:hypothetical protein Tco_0149414 [Tanacetum coccineum]
MVERNRGEHLIRRFAGRGNESHPRDVKIASLKQRIQELKRRQENKSKRAWETLNGENPFSYVCDYGNHRGGVQKETLCRLGLQVEITECVGNRITYDIGDGEEEYPFVNKYPSFQEEPIVLVEEKSCPIYDTDNEEEESMVYDTDIEDVI